MNHPIIKIISIVFIFTVTVSGSTTIKISGHAPVLISSEKLEFEYNRIYYALSGRNDSRGNTIQIIYYDETNPRFNQVLPEWGGGGAIGTDTIIVPTRFKPFLQQNLQQTLIHELGHIAINRIAQKTAIPRWFHEGVAMTMAGEFTPQEQVAVSRAIISATLPSLNAVDSVNLFPQGKANVCYSQSHLAVIFIIDRFGISTVRNLLFVAERQGSFDSALTQVLTLTTTEFEKIYREYLYGRYKYFFMIADWNIAWIAIALLAVVAAVVARMRYVRRKKTMEIAGDDQMSESHHDGTISTPDAEPLDDVLPEEVECEDTEPDQQPKV